MATGNIRLLLADVDGTLFTKDNVLTAAAKASPGLHAGMALAVTSGRPPSGMSMLIELSLSLCRALSLRAYHQPQV